MSQSSHESGGDYTHLARVEGSRVYSLRLGVERPRARPQLQFEHDMRTTLLCLLRPRLGTETIEA